MKVQFSSYYINNLVTRMVNEVVNILLIDRF